MSYANLDLVCDNHFIILERCDCKRSSSADWCGECYGGERPAGDVDLNPLLSNLAIAGALTRSFRLGDNHGWDTAADQCSCGGVDSDDDRRPARPVRWWPNARGMVAP